MRIDFKTILKYLRGELSSKEEHKIEREALDDPFLSDAIEGYESFNTEEVESDVRELKGNLTDHSSGIPWFSIAASLIIVTIAGVSVWYYSQSETEKIAFENKEVKELTQKPEEPAIVLDSTVSISQESKETNSEEEIAYSEPSQTEDINQEENDFSIENEEEKISKTPDLELQEMMVNDEEIPEEEVDLNIELSENVAGVELQDNNLKKQKSYSLRPSAIFREESVDISENEVDTRNNQKSSENSKIKSVRGKVVGEDGEGIPGVNVVIQGSAEGTVTDIQGNFTLFLDSIDSQLLISTVGYVSQNIDLEKDNNFINVMLSEDVSELSEVVVTGYGTSREEEFYEPEIILPRPEGGYRALRNYVKENQLFPEGSEVDKAVVKLIVSITEKGELGNIEVEKTDGDEFTQEAIRLLKNGPAWSSGTVDGNPQEMDVKVRIKLKKLD
ncbi:carboxypeptidase-like regulatory domain-containing protein [Mangrovivirga cuniculi]|uniref:Uncharacterized protein n=1 Tax=Mangrovivirga cuniculi TaxID=2715131 RepID=A0A4D7JW53_9BACT|nr:carboxypeptidase-like regulatory domain-containing protein [Mangrovivirga cuniculi]QCK16386.1 hypothetical protein DCC35_17420 [Mangrovivirga cuniculi]